MSKILLLLLISSVFTLDHFEWKGYSWELRDDMRAKSGPGPNFFSPYNVIPPADSDGDLVMKVTKEDGDFYCSEFYLDNSLGYGTYQIDINQKVEEIANLDENIVFGFFLYKNDEYEIDIEISKWGQKGKNAPNMDYISQPYIENKSGILFKLPEGHQNTRHSFLWAPDKIYWKAEDIDTKELLYEWTAYSNLRKEDNAFVLHFNFWMMSGIAPKVDEQTITITDFKFTKYKG